MDLLTITIWILILVLIVGLLVVVWRNGQLNARIDGLSEMMEHQAKDFTAALEKQADTFTVQLGQVTREATLKIAAMRNEWVDVRQRWTVTANQFLLAKEWIRLLVGELRRNNLAVPVPPNVEEIPRGDESVHFPEVEAAGEYRLDDLIAEITAENDLEGLEPLNG
jgi:hypothetical protein